MLLTKIQHICLHLTLTNPFYSLVFMCSLFINCSKKTFSLSDFVWRLFSVRVGVARPTNSWHLASRLNSQFYIYIYACSSLAFPRPPSFSSVFPSECRCVRPCECVCAPLAKAMHIFQALKKSHNIQTIF